METWRLLNTGFADGATNMAVDEAILLSHARGEAPPTWRFYGWRPSCLSIGLFQRAEKEVDTDECRLRGIDVVRRSTGGRAVLHASEVTYSVVTSRNHAFAHDSIVESYRWISRTLVVGLRMLGVDVQTARRRERGGSSLPAVGGGAGLFRTPACFDTPSNHEITVTGRKVVGSAQLRKGGAILQHGSILLEVDLVALASVLRLGRDVSPEFAVRVLGSRMMGLNEALDREVGFEEVAQSITRGIQEVEGLILVPGDLSEGEQRLAQRLREGKYASREWNFRR